MLRNHFCSYVDTVIQFKIFSSRNCEAKVQRNAKYVYKMALCQMFVFRRHYLFIHSSDVYYLPIFDIGHSFETFERKEIIPICLL